MAAIVNKKEVARGGGFDQIGESAADVAAGWLGVGIVGVDEDGDVVLGEAVTVDETAVHSPDVIDAAFEFGFGARVVDSDQHCFPRHISPTLSLQRSVTFITHVDHWI